MTASGLRELVEGAEKAAEGNDVDGAVVLYHKVIEAANMDGDEDIREREKAIYALGSLLAREKRADELGSLLKSVRPFFAQIPKARTAKIVRTLIDNIAKTGCSVEAQMQLCRESIEWTKEEKRSFLKQRVEARLADLCLQNRDYQEALALLSSLVYEVKKMDDKALLVEIHLLESRAHHALRNVPRSRAALTAARTAANAIYCPPALQGQIDIQAGVLHAEEKDYKTANSYFFEAFETFDSLDDSAATKSLKYMLLCKIMTNNPQDVHTIIGGKLALKYGGRDIAAMAAVADSYSARSLEKFNIALDDFVQELKHDDLVNRHLANLYDKLLEQNLCKIIEPFSEVQLDHISHLIQLPTPTVEKKLSQMILDKTFHGVLDQEQNMLVVYEDPVKDELYTTALDTIANMNKVVETLYSKAQNL
mmetsp:Transcript_21944/g.61686  ORF Transcript_21944/g.61686 Transcript_21944/m.61686 type:complete len:422 (+) Transcript_21944:44-1309(+)|eukprot:CAMPEP_0119129642 /NCGR_PEP_ID=MMETSP1310-20130426/7302_1 /TAXON_ID=464262 /ORGANISM="Genus nov. species nov., Strain RCC2339" /LENGTH=421 /DNA_ID=CAMNT_0007120077 /DNA_START=30 /DNA_END=1295 /DNA_ORIENTATION=-